jgi:hypothetical protein
LRTFLRLAVETAGRVLRVVARLAHQAVLGFRRRQQRTYGGTDGEAQAGQHERLLAAEVDICSSAGLRSGRKPDLFSP